MMTSPTNTVAVRKAGLNPCGPLLFPMVWAGVAALALWFTAVALATDPRIDRIERFVNNQVLLHFDTEPNRTYELQFLENLSTAGHGGTWTNLFVAPASPFPNHYIVVDTRTNRARCYRLKVTP